MRSSWKSLAVVLNLHIERISIDRGGGIGFDRERVVYRTQGKVSGNATNELTNYFPCPIKNEGRGLPPALTRVATARHTRTGAGSGGPPGHSGALFFGCSRKPPYQGPPKIDYVKDTCSVGFSTIFNHFPGQVPNIPDMPRKGKGHGNETRASERHRIQSPREIQKPRGRSETRRGRPTTPTAEKLTPT